ACVGILLLMILIYHLASGKRGSFWPYLDLDTPRLTIGLADFARPTARHLPLIGALVLALATIPLAASVKDREEIIPPRTAFSSFPLFHAGWIGREQGLEADVLDTLKLTDYIQANYSNAVKPLPVNFYVAYYESQRKGASIHSPRSCLPGGGWRITSLQDYVIEGVTHPGGEPLVVNRAVIQKGDITQVAYYWFDGRSRNITNEYLAKWYLFWDGMNESRSDGALIRVITLVDDPANIDKADAALGDFVRDFYPLMKDYVPS
ncbi:MAG TPA: EpsI family protein, partial [Spongiibacteraceae bacterium]|nr:EpsI family protein [Spongiibacteraceae bacterium]